jgi:hypothetical protein
MPRKTILEQKIWWYFNNVEDFIDKDALSLIIMSEFNEEGILQIPETNINEEKKKLYDRYWKRFDPDSK